MICSPENICLLKLPILHYSGRVQRYHASVMNCGTPPPSVGRTTGGYVRYCSGLRGPFRKFSSWRRKVNDVSTSGDFPQTADRSSSDNWFRFLKRSQERRDNEGQLQDAVKCGRFGPCRLRSWRREQCALTTRHDVCGALCCGQLRRVVVGRENSLPRSSHSHNYRRSWLILHSLAIVVSFRLGPKTDQYNHVLPCFYHVTMFFRSTKTIFWFK